MNPRKSKLKASQGIRARIIYTKSPQEVVDLVARRGARRRRRHRRERVRADPRLHGPHEDTHHPERLRRGALRGARQQEALSLGVDGGQALRPVGPVSLEWAPAPWRDPTEPGSGSSAPRCVLGGGAG